jgi:hypothetical protein
MEVCLSAALASLAFLRSAERLAVRISRTCFSGDTGLAAVELLIRNSVLRFPFVRKPKFSQIKVGCPRSRGSA